MNVKHEQLNNFFIALTLSVCLFTVVDIAYDERIWEFSTFTLKARIWALCITVASFYLVNYIFRRIARFFTDKNKDKKSGKRKEYTLVFLVNFILLNAIHLFIMVYITQMYSGAFFRWRESVLINVTGSVLLLLYYTMIRNHILSKTLIQQNIQLEKVKVDQLETELKFLKSRYHPHFLFNALNTIYFQVDERNREARQSIEQLSHLLRYQLYDIEQEVTMEQEINYLKSYVAFQRQRTSERLVLEMYFDPALKEQKIHPLMFQPFIENAFKYVRGDYKIQLEMKLDGNQIRVEIKNSISQTQTQNTVRKKEAGMGIENLKRRLNLLYPGKHTLEIKQTENRFVVELIITAD